MACRGFGCVDGLALAGRMLDPREARRLGSPGLVRVDYAGSVASARCRDVSEVGMKLDSTAPLAIDDVVRVTFSPGLVLEGVVVSRRGAECGVVFTAPLDRAALLGDAGAQGTVHPATLASLGQRAATHVAAPLDAGGTRAADDHGFRPGLSVLLMTAPGREERARVSWAAGDAATLTLRRPR